MPRIGLIVNDGKPLALQTAETIQQRLEAAGHAVERASSAGGMVDPAVLEGLGLDPERYSGFAAGLGVERFCMVRHGIDDIRRLYTSDLRFLEQF